MGTEDKKEEITATEVIEQPHESDVPTNDLEMDAGPAVAQQEDIPASEEIDNSMDLGDVPELSLSADAADEADSVPVDEGKDMTLGDMPALELGAEGEVQDPEEVEAALEATKNEVGEKTEEATNTFEDKLKEIDSLMDDAPAPVEMVSEKTNPDLDETVKELNQELEEPVAELSEVAEDSMELELSVEGDNSSIEALDQELASLDTSLDDDTTETADLSSELDEATATHLLDELKASDASLEEVSSPDQDLNVLMNEDLNSSLAEMKATPVTSISEAPLRSVSQSVQDYDVILQKDDQLLQLSATVNLLRAERAKWLQEVSEWKIKYQRLEDEFKLIKNEIEEKTIEVEILHKRSQRDVETVRKELFVSEEKRSILREQNKKLEDEVKKFGLKNKFDHAKIHLRENELEQKLELLKADSQSQIQNRDEKIMELKRRIDIMEFDLEAMGIKESRAKQMAMMWQKKLEGVVGQLKTAVLTVEDDQEADVYKLERRKLAG